MICLYLMIAVHLAVVPATVGQKFHFPYGIESSQTCGEDPQTSVQSEGSIVLTRADFIAFDRRVEISANLKLCTVDLKSCPPKNLSDTTACYCKSRDGDRFYIHVASTTKQPVAGMTIQAVVPGRGALHNIFGAVEIGTLPRRSENTSLVEMTYNLNQETPKELLRHQTLGVCPGEWFVLEVCSSNGHPKANLRLTMGKSVKFTVGKCIRLTDRLTQGHDEEIEFEYVEPGQRGCHQKNVIIMKNDINACPSPASTARPKPTVTPTTPVPTTPAPTTPAPTTPAPTTPVPTTPTSGPVGPTAAYVIRESNIAGICPDSPRSLQTLSNGQQRLTQKDKDSVWVVFQRRSSGSISFDQTWDRYVSGFGQMSQDFWLGLEPLYNLCNSSSKCELMVNIVYHGEANRVPTVVSGCYTAHYKEFYLGGPETNYRLFVSGYSGTAGDSLLWELEDWNVNGMPFTTADADHDKSAGNCAAKYGPWWHNSCNMASLNSPWGRTYWRTVNPSSQALSFTEIKVKTK